MEIQATSQTFWEDQWLKTIERSNAEQPQRSEPAGTCAMNKWDNMAKDFARRTNGEKASAKRDATLKQLVAKGILTPETRVLDIGAGPGSWALPMAKICAHVTALEPSGGMIEIMSDRIEQEKVNNINIVQNTWQETDLAEQGWEKAFDLVVAFMSPAVATPKAFSKMLQCAAKGCAIRGWAARRQPQVLKDLWEMIMKRSLDDKPQSILYKINLLFSMGLYPDIYFDVVEWDQVVSVETEAENQVSFFTKVAGKADGDIRPVIHSYLQNRAGKGQIRKKQKGLTATAVFLVDSLI